VADHSTLGEHYRAGRLTDEALNAAIAGYLLDPAPGPRGIADGIMLDIAAAVLASPYATEVLEREDATPAQKRTAVRTAILLARVG
jgi:hypothetical protein